jgi:non-ribosomal peptide synthetase component F
MAIRSAVSGPVPASETAVPSRVSARAASVAQAAAASASVRTVNRSASSCRPHPVVAAVSSTASNASRAGRWNVSVRSPGPVPDRNPVNG